MEGNIFELILVALLVLGGGAIIAVGVMLGLNERKRLVPPNPKAEKASMPEDKEENSALRQVYATVADQACQVKMIGMKTPKTVQIFTVVFQTAEQQRLTFEVPEEMYAGLEVGQRGMLSYVDENLYGFELEED